MEYFSELGYIDLLFSSFLAATVLPLSSEVVLSALLLKGLSPAMLVIIATLGNVLGSLVNYALGRWVSLSAIKKWLRMSDEDFNAAEKRFTRFGIISLLFAWVPIIGDPLTLIAGILRIKLHWFILLVTTGKFLRYWVVSYLVLKVI